jgi:hypothetical protein
VLGQIGAALLFAICGAWSSRLLSIEADWAVCAFPVPFALLCVLLFLRTTKAILIVPLNLVVWLAAYMTAMAVAFEVRNEHYLFPMCLAGLVGGLGLALCAGIAHRPMLSSKHLIVAGVVGCAGGAAFGPWLAAHFESLRFGGGPRDPLQPLRLQYACAVWQTVVGTYLYTVCTQAEGGTRPANEGDRQ